MGKRFDEDPEDPYTYGPPKWYQVTNPLYVILAVAGIVVLAAGFIRVWREEAKTRAQLEEIAADYETALAQENAVQQQAEEVIQADYSVYEKLAVGYDVRILIVGDGQAYSYTSDGSDVDWGELVRSHIRETYMLGSEFHGSASVNNIGLINSGSYAGYVRTQILDDGEYDLVILCCGQYDDEDTLSLYYEALLRSVLSANPDCSVIAVLEATLENDAAKIDKICELCEYYDVPVVDMVSAWDESDAEYEDLIGEDGSLPSGTGYRVYAEAVSSVIDENVAAGTGKTQAPAKPLNSDVKIFENFAIYSDEEEGEAGPEQVDDQTYTLPVSGTGILGVGFRVTLGEHRVDVYVDGAFFQSLTVDSDYDGTLKYILPLDGTVTVEEEVTVMFESEDSVELYCVTFSSED